MSLRENILRDGFVIIPNLLSTEEITKLRHLVAAHMKSDLPENHNLGKTENRAACVMPELGWFFYHPKVLSVMKEIVSADKIMFTNHCDAASGCLTSWHKDDGADATGSMEGLYFEKFTYDLDDCQVYKMGIYLQDHFHNLSGLRVRRKSHRLAGHDQGEEVYLQTKTGDVVVFDVRLTHSGQMDVVPVPLINKPLTFCLAVIRKIFRTRKIEVALKSFYDRIAGDRMSIFFTFGFPNEYTIKFARNNMQIRLSSNPKLPIYLPDALRQKLIENQVLLAEDYFSDLKP